MRNMGILAIIVERLPQVTKFLWIVTEDPIA
jgi:hypothetical protein